MPISNFELVQLYGDAIIVKKPLDVTDPELKTARNDRSEVIDFAIEDLEAAAELLPKFSELSTEDNGRISQEGCWAFLSRVALYEGTWQRAVAMQNVVSVAGHCSESFRKGNS